MVLIMLTAMAIAGVALVRVVDSANVISGNFAFRQSTLNIADMGVEAAVAELIAIPAADREKAWPGGCTTNCRYFPVRSVGNMLDSKGLPIVGNTGGAVQAIQWNANANWDANDIPLAPSGYNRRYAIRYVIDRQCNQAFPGVANPPNDACSNDTPLTPVSKKAGGGGLPAPDGIIFYRVTVQVTGPRNTQSHVQVFLSF